MSPSREFHLGCCNGTRITFKRAEDVGTSQDTLCPAVLEKGANIDRRHHSPLSCFRLFDAEAFERRAKIGVKSSELNICEEHPTKKNEEIRAHASGAEHCTCAVADHSGRTDSRAVSNGCVAIKLKDHMVT